MVSGDFAKRNLGFFPWGSGCGLPEMSVPGVMYGNEWWIPAPERPATKLRVLADGRPQLLVPASGGARVVGLGKTVVHIDVRSEHWVIDAVLGDDQSVITLERSNIREFAVKQIHPDGTSGWELTSAEPRNQLGEVTSHHSHLLSAPGGRIYLANRGSLFRVDDGSGDCLFQWRGSNAVVLPDGRIGFARYDKPKNRTAWVTVDLDTASEIVVESDPDCDSYVQYAIGVDNDGNVFGHFAGDLVRMGNSIQRDWHLSLNGVVVSGQYGMTTMSLSADRRTGRLDDGHSIEIDLSDNARRGYLVNRTDEGGYVLYRRTRGDFGTLVYLDSEGALVRSEKAPEDIWFTNSRAQRPSVQSVTGDGGVLFAVHASDGLYIVGIRPGRSVIGSS